MAYCCKSVAIQIYISWPYPMQPRHIATVLTLMRVSYAARSANKDIRLSEHKKTTTHNWN